MRFIKYLPYQCDKPVILALQSVCFDAPTYYQLLFSHTLLTSLKKEKKDMQKNNTPLTFLIA